MDSQSSGCDLTIEVLYRILQLLQSMGYRFPGKAYFYGDNHTDIKTPAVLLFLAYLVRIGVFTEAKACFLLVGEACTRNKPRPISGWFTERIQT